MDTLSNSSTLHGLFESRVKEAPDRIALDFEGQRVTYRELNRLANRLAHHLREISGVRPDDRIGILTRHPPTTIVAMVASLKAGGAYVPLDPDYPPAVIQQILDDATPTAVLFESTCAANLAFFNGDLFALDVIMDTLETPDSDPEPVSGESDLAYVIYTSGTTGAPKGVAVEHRSIINTTTWRNDYYHFGPNDVTLQIARPSFDSSVEDIFCMLTSGGCLLFPLRNRITDRRYLVDLIATRNVTNFLITPALYKRLLPGLEASATASLRAVTVAGEWFTIGLVQEHYRRLPHVPLYNEYGPAENAVCSTAYLLSAADDVVLIGKPIVNTQAFVLDEAGNSVAPGEIGELFLAGVGLARCYLGNAKLTDEKFFLGPAATKHVRVYRSGDMVLERVDGNLQFVGRRDSQVKIRGQRVEVDHVAQRLSKAASVDVLVLYDVDSLRPPRLIAFAVGATVDDLSRLRAMAPELLPDYMVPSMIVSIDEIPVTANGKIDREMLLRTFAGSSETEVRIEEPVSVIERDIQAIWRELLPGIRIRLDEDIFVMGADSLTVMDLILNVEQRMRFTLQSADPYRHRTIRDLARFIERERLRDAAGGAA